MRSVIKLAVFLTAALFLFTSCATMKTARVVPEPPVKDLSPGYLAGEISDKVDGWVVLLDTSLSMHKRTEENYVKFDIAKTFVQRMNKTLPPISSVSGLRTFGRGPQLSENETRLVYGMSAFDQKDMRTGILSVNHTGGPTPMTAAIEAAASDLKNIKGNKAVIIVSDGEDLDNTPVLAAQKMIEALDNTVCIYTVHVGNDKDGKLLMENIAKTSSCGYMVSALDMVPSDPMAEYVTDIFLGQKTTGLGYSKAVSLLKPLSTIPFEFDDHTLTREGKSILDKNIEILAEHPEIKLNIEGHASAKGPLDYNQKLSEKRAQAVRDYIISKGKIPEDRLTTVGYGKTRPLVIETNPDQIDSPAAKSNMQVILDVVKEE